MKKNRYISIILLIVFSFILLHNVVPHNHHAEISELNNHNHHHHGHDHNHHHDNSNKEDHHNDTDQSHGLFSHPEHIFTTTEILFISNNCSQKNQNLYHLIPIKNFLLKQINTSKKREPPNFRDVIPLFYYYSTYSYRGPPIFPV